MQVELGDGTLLPAGAVAMVDVTLCLPAYDLVASGLHLGQYDDGRPRYLPEGAYDRIVLRDDIPMDVHLFRDEVDRLDIWVSVETRRALKKSRVNAVQYAWPDRSNFFEFRG